MTDTDFDTEFNANSTQAFEDGIDAANNCTEFDQLWETAEALFDGKCICISLSDIRAFSTLQLSDLYIQPTEEHFNEVMHAINPPHPKEQPCHQ